MLDKSWEITFPRLGTKKLFFEKKTSYFFRKMSHSAKKCKRGDRLGIINIYSVAKYQKNSKGDSFETLKNFRKKVAQCRKKSKWGLFSLVRFCRSSLKSKKMKGGTLCTKFTVAGIVLGSFSSFYKKWNTR